MAPRAEVEDAVKCSVCGEIVEYDESKPGNGFKCKKQAGKHIVEAKTYYHMGGAHVANMRDRQMFSPQIILRPGQDKVDPATGKIVLDPGLKVFFERGQYSTADPEEQFYLDAKGLPFGEAGLKQWRSVYLTPEQNRNIARDEYEDLQRKIAAGNSLLEQQRKRVGANG